MNREFEGPNCLSTGMLLTRNLGLQILFCASISRLRKLIYKEKTSGKYRLLAWRRLSQLLSHWLKSSVYLIFSPVPGLREGLGRSLALTVSTSVWSVLSMCIDGNVHTYVHTICIHRYEIQTSSPSVQITGVWLDFLPPVMPISSLKLVTHCINSFLTNCPLNDRAACTCSHNLS